MANLHYLFSIWITILLYGSMNSVAQGTIGSTLSQEIVQNASETFRVAIYFNEKVNLDELNSSLTAEQVLVMDRPLFVKTALKDVADHSQQKLIFDLQTQFGNWAFNEKRLWINNCMVIDATEEMIDFISVQENIELVDLNDARKITVLDPPKRANNQGLRSPGGAEPGLISVGANLLWNMGYTGKNRISYSIDTGVWPNHPAIDDQFVANYFPLNYAWFAYDSELPSDKNSDHGTHTIGTALGLDENTNDTIGVAFNAFYIASDPVATSLATVKPLTDFMFAFEWAFDPDGDPNTTSDIPDVINNSWGYDVPTDDELCESYASEMFSAVQAAGIACIFSAGNSGPGPMTIGIPHHINTGLVNSFTVGAVNAHQAELPIAGFSSHGPTICGGTGSLEIKPEVVAPGVDVRSAIRDGGYDNYQGTSMASPHVTGVVLLLREAFPMATGEEVLLALYNSAMDLGDLGEDNTYGKGMINALAAFNYLSQTYTPVPPNSSTLDLAVTQVSPNSDLMCGLAFTPQIELSNLGLDAITEVTITYSIVGEGEQVYNWSGNLTAGQSETVTLNSVSISEPSYVEFWVRSSLAGTPLESNPFNNNKVERFHVLPESDLPFFEGFENNQLFDGTWLVKNPDVKITWDTLITAGLDWSSYSAYMNFKQYNPKAGQHDVMISPVITLPSSEEATLKFEVSYSFVHSVFTDSLEVLLSTDCGGNWASIYYKGGEGLGLPDSITDGDNDFFPSLPEHWRTETVSLQAYQGQDILVKFQSSNYRGSHLVLDNIRIFSNQDPASIIEFDDVAFSVYPNPTNDVLSLTASVSIKGKLTIVDMYGRMVKQMPLINLSKNPLLISTSELATGSYFVHFVSNDIRMVQPLVIAR